jgi:hypothetical protein
VAQPPAIDPSLLQSVWNGLVRRLDQWDPQWRGRAGLDAPRPVQRACGSGPPISNEGAFEAFTVALLSGNTRWDRIKRVRGKLGEPFDGFDPARFATRSDEHIREKVLGWLRERQAASPRLAGGLLRLRETARIFAGGANHASAQALIDAACEHAEGSPEHVALLLGSSKEWKLPGFGVALAAEGLRLLDFDLAKPDRHLLRAVGSWGFVVFRRWSDKGAFTPPDANPSETLAAMLSVRELAKVADLPVTKTSSAIWIAGAVSGARLTNEEFRQMVGS